MDSKLSFTHSTLTVSNSKFILLRHFNKLNTLYACEGVRRLSANLMIVNCETPDTKKKIHHNIIGTQKSGFQKVQLVPHNEVF